MCKTVYELCFRMAGAIGFVNPDLVMRLVTIGAFFYLIDTYPNWRPMVEDDRAKSGD